MNQLTITLRVSQLLTLDQTADRSNPHESCALLLGKRRENVYDVEEVIPVSNKYSSEVSFAMDENELLKIYKYAELSNTSVVGIFHSHPSKPFPSDTDKTFMEINPVPWIIKSTITDEMRCFIFSDVLKGKIDGIEEIKMIVVKD
ncbi:Mov34/MPN/PAD-1 family protein [Candidatus Nitrosocosmicus arcticus]|uniref:Mov34/MPN/PAD-1 family protein n=1 Tax=Candidatus Nitrosocosmicus arcticus TaxID=2035267 RepID=A0A557SUF7_9ARCH|nr:M67 family metallopeptidase [Candidatus Nitrosocosmicus arcticus]TVP40233.1 Mov34/MPN/PAD-1 family protein [Candidatus Nitrosocosmicus arcticus]